VVVVDSANPANRFEGWVQTYNWGTGVMQVYNIQNILSVTPWASNSTIFTVNLDSNRRSRKNEFRSSFTNHLALA